MTKCMQTLSIWNIADTSKAQLNHSRGALYGITPWQKLRWQVLNSEFLNGFPLTLSLLFEHSQDVIAISHQIWCPYSPAPSFHSVDRYWYANRNCRKIAHILKIDLIKIYVQSSVTWLRSRYQFYDLGKLLVLWHSGTPSVKEGW